MVRLQGTGIHGGRRPLKAWSRTSEGRARIASLDATAGRLHIGRESVRRWYQDMVDAGILDFEAHREAQHSRVARAVERTAEAQRRAGTVIDLRPTFDRMKAAFETEEEDGPIISEDTAHLFYHLNTQLLAETWPRFVRDRGVESAPDMHIVAMQAAGLDYRNWYLMALPSIPAAQALEDLWFSQDRRNVPYHDAPSVCGMKMGGHAVVVW